MALTGEFYLAIGLVVFALVIIIIFLMSLFNPKKNRFDDSDKLRDAINKRREVVMAKKIVGRRVRRR